MHLHAGFNLQIWDSTLVLLPPLEDHEVGKTCENWSQKTRVLQKLLETKQAKLHFTVIGLFKSYALHYITPPELKRRMKKQQTNKQGRLTVCNSRG